MYAKRLWTLVGCAVAAVCAQAADEPTPLKTGAANLEVAALVNGEPITRTELAKELIDTYGRAQLDLMINRKIVEMACRDAKIEVDDKEIDADIEATIRKLGMKRANFIDSVLSRQGITYQQYRRDRVWPKLAMVKLVKPLVKVTEEDIKNGFEATWGPKVDCRMLVVGETGRAQELWEKLAAEKGEARVKMFEDLCKLYSIDSASKPYGGQVSPFNRHSSNPDLEKKIFAMKEGELSSIIQMTGGNVIFLCVKHIPPNPDVKLDTIINQTTKETARQALHDGIFTKKLQFEADRVFAEAKKKARVENFISGDFSPDALQQIASPDAGKSTKR